MMRVSWKSSFSNDCLPCWEGIPLRRAGVRIKGAILSLEREYPPYTPKRKDEGPSPSTPHIGSLDLEELHALRNVSAVYMASP